MKTFSSLVAASAPMAAAVLFASAQAIAFQDVKAPNTPPPVLQDIKTPAPILPPKEATPARQPVPIGQVIEQARAKLPGSLAGATPAIDPNAVYFDQSADGSVWTMGRAYKAQFNAAGSTYYPKLGPNAPQHYPLTFRLTGAEVGGTPISFANDVAATRAGDSVQFERGGLTELYSIRPEAVEQEFVFQSLPGTGDLVVRLSVATELAAASMEDGFHFSNDLGHVTYGKAMAVDAQGHRSAAETILDGNSIEIRVPAAFVADAVMPLTIDPVITTFTIDASTSFDTSPDVAFDATNGRYLVCWERVFVATDHDVWAQQYDTSGVLVAGSGAYIDFTSNYWANPKCANNNIGNNYLVVAAVGLSSPRSIWGRTRDAASTAMGTQFAISAEPSFDCYGPDVGGDPVTVGPTYFLVVWTRVFTSTDYDVHAQLIDSTGALNGGLILVDNSASTLDFSPNVSKSDGLAPFSTQNWTVTWTREFSPGLDYDIWGSQLLWNGTITHPTYMIDFSGAYDYSSEASTVLDGATGERDYMTVYTRYDLAGGYDIHGAIYNGTAYVTDANLSALDTSVSQIQVTPSVDSDGCNYAVAYSEQFSTSTFDYDMYVSTFSRVGSSIKVSEAHQLLDFSTTQDIFPQITSQHSAGGSGSRSMVVWQNYTTGFADSNITGGLYANVDFTSFCFPGVDAAACPCGNPPSSTGRGCNNSSSTGGALLSKSGNAVLSSDTVVFTATGEKPTATSVFLQGSSANTAGLTFGQGIRCAAGTLKRLYVKTASGGSASAPVGSDPRVSVRSAALGDTINAGESRYYLVYYRDPIVLGGCPATSTFNATQTGALCWIP
jgi:hypothetical protein